MKPNDEEKINRREGWGGLGGGTVIWKHEAQFQIEHHLLVLLEALQTTVCVGELIVSAPLKHHFTAN